jgi:hypothetical protein
MKTGLKRSLGVLALGIALAACAQSPAVATGSGSQALLSLPGSDPYQSAATGEIVREIDDPHTGDRWLLVRNDQVPGGPGRLVLVAAHRNRSAGAALGAESQTGTTQFLPVIRAGDRLIVEEHTTRVDAVLEARALNPAAPGSALEVRLTIGGNVVRAVALGPGRAALQPNIGIRP